MRDLERVRHEHRRCDDTDTDEEGNRYDIAFCETDDEDWPCTTTRVLNDLEARYALSAREPASGEAALREIASGMAACVQALDRRGAWFSRSHTALTLRDSLRVWADDFAALTAAPRAGEGEK